MEPNFILDLKFKLTASSEEWAGHRPPGPSNIQIKVLSSRLIQN